MRVSTDSAKSPKVDVAHSTIAPRVDCDPASGRIKWQQGQKSDVSFFTTLAERGERQAAKHIGVDPLLYYLNCFLASAALHFIPIEGPDHLVKQKEEADQNGGRDVHCPCGGPVRRGASSNARQNEAVEQDAASGEVEHRKERRVSCHLPNANRVWTTCRGTQGQNDDSDRDPQDGCLYLPHGLQDASRVIGSTQWTSV
jgi:hypothetical protein